MKKTFRNILTTLFIAGCTSLTTSCSDDIDDKKPAGDDKNKTTGFVLIGQTSTLTTLAKYFDKIPTGTVDLSTGQDFKQFQPRGQWNHFMYGNRIDGGEGVAKIAVNKEGKIYQVSYMPAQENPNRTHIVNDKLGILYFWGKLGVTLFNPEEMKPIGDIDTSMGEQPHPTEKAGYRSLYVRGNDLFASLRIAAAGFKGTQFQAVYLHHADMKTMKYVGSTNTGIEPDAVSINTPIATGATNIDTDGTLYIEDAGDTSSGIAASIYKINPGEGAFDEDYRFQPHKIVAPDNIFYPTMSCFKVIGNGKAVCRLTTIIPPQCIELFNAIPGKTNKEKFVNLYNDTALLMKMGALLQKEGRGNWCLLDLKKQTAEVIKGIPETSASGSASFFRDGDDLYLSVDLENAYYKYNHTTGSVSKAFDVKGASVGQCVNLSTHQ